MNLQTKALPCGFFVHPWVNPPLYWARLSSSAASLTNTVTGMSPPPPHLPCHLCSAVTSSCRFSWDYTQVDVGFCTDFVYASFCSVSSPFIFPAPTSSTFELFQPHYPLCFHGTYVSLFPTPYCICLQWPISVNLDSTCTPT